MKVRTLLVILAFFALILTSETIYQLKNNSGLKITVFIAASRLLAKADLTEESLKYFEKAYDTRLEQFSYDSYQKPKEESKFPKLPENRRLMDEYKSILRNLNGNELTNTYASWGKILYNLGLSAHKNGESDLVIPYWKSAVSIAPEWSYFHIELANFYLSTGDVLNAKETLHYCLQFNHPRKHCQMYLDDNFYSNNPREVGFLEEFIEKEI